MADETKRYSDKELSLIIRTALDIEKKEGRHEAGGLSLPEMEAIAKESGISVAHLRSAIASAMENKKSMARLMLGGESSFTATTSLPRSLTPGEIEGINYSLPSLASSSESGLVGGDTLTWKRGFLRSALDGFPLRLKIERIEGGTRIAASADLRSIATLFFGLAGGLGALAGIKLALFAMLIIGIGGLGLPTGVGMAGLGAAIGAGGFWLLARLAFRAFAKRSREKLETLVEKVKAAIPGRPGI